MSLDKIERVGWSLLRNIDKAFEPVALAIWPWIVVGLTVAAVSYLLVIVGQVILGL